METTWNILCESGSSSTEIDSYFIFKICARFRLGTQFNRVLSLKPVLKN